MLMPMALHTRCTSTLAVKEKIEEQISMRNHEAVLLAILLLIPTLSFAHGEEIIYTLCIEVVSIICFIIVLIAVNLSQKGKGILASTYILTTLIMFFITNNVPYRQNMNIINWSLILVPALILTLSYLYLKPRYY